MFAGQKLAAPAANQLKDAPNSRPQHRLSPDVDIVEYDDHLVLYANVPGVADGSLEATVDGDLLTLSVMSSLEQDKKLTPLYTEYAVDGYYRQFILDEMIDRSKIRAVLRSGVVELYLPKVEQARTHRIEVQAA
jgi:HSP20 family molecular chaperone IbpA